MPRFDQLSTEIILEIFDYLSSHEILYAFFNLNRRFNSILSQHQKNLLRNDQSDWTLSIDFFVHLRSLVISSLLPIHFDRIELLIKSKTFRRLISFQIQTKFFHPIYASQTRHTILFESIFNENNSLQNFGYLATISPSNFPTISTFQRNENLRSLSLNLTNFISILLLFPYTPNLKDLDLTIARTSNEIEWNGIFDFEDMKLEKFSLTYARNSHGLGWDESKFSFLASFLQQFAPSLSSLSMNLSEKAIHLHQFNGHLLEQQLLKSLIQLKHFHFYVKFSEESVDIETILSTFETRFWLDHHWSIGMHQNFIYTLPFHFNQFVDFDKIHSTICQSPRTWNRLRSISLSQTCELNFDSFQQMLSYIPNLTSIHLQSTDPRYPKFTEHSQLNTIHSAFNNVTTIECGFEYLHNLKPWSREIFPNVRRLFLHYNLLAIINFRLSTQYLTLSHLYSPQQSTGNDEEYFSTIEHVIIEFLLERGEDFDNDLLSEIENLLKTFQNMKMVLLNFQLRDGDRSNKALNFPQKIVTSLSANKHFQNYEIAIVENYLQLIRKNDG